MSRTGAQLLVAGLEAAGVDVVFGLPGVHNLAAWEALRESPIRLVGVRHEQAAVYAADGYARVSGRLGVAVEERLAPFAVAEVVRVARRARDGVHAVDELEGLLGDVDVVVNLLPATTATDGMFDATMFAAMREGALFVNAGRGRTVDTDALLQALEARRVRAVLDVMEPEPLPPEHPLWGAPNCIITPHSAGDTPGAERASWKLAGDQLRRYAAGEELLNVVREGY